MSDAEHHEEQPEQQVPVARPIGPPPASQAAAPSPPPGNPLDLDALPRRQAVLDLALVCLVMLVVPFGLDFILALTLGGDLTNVAVPTQIPPYVGLIVQKWFSATLAMGMAAYFLLTHRLPAASFGIRRDDVRAQLGWSIVAYISVYLAFGVTVILLTMFLQEEPAAQHELQKRTQFLQMMPIRNLGAALALLIPVAIHEELLFRGMLLPFLHRVGLPWWLAVLVSAGIFASLHITQGALAIPQVLVLGIVFGIFIYLSRSLLVVVIAHFLFDFTQFQLARFVLPWLEHAQHATTGPA